MLRVPFGSPPNIARRGTRKGYLFRGGPIGELLSLTSLFLQARFYVLSTSVGHFTSKGVPFKTEFTPPLRGAFGQNIDPVLFSDGGRDLADELAGFLQQIRLIPPKYHFTVALAASHYARALREVGVDEEMVFVRLVAAIETAARKQSISNDLLQNKKPEDLFRIDKLTQPEVQELQNLLETRKAKARFTSFLEKFSSGFFEGMPDKPAHTQITPATLSSVANAIYDARSGYLHNGYQM